MATGPAVFDWQPINPSSSSAVKWNIETRKLSPLDNWMVKCGISLHEELNTKLAAGNSEVYKDERFVQAYLYDIMCREHDKPSRQRIKLEFPHPLLQGFKPDKKGAPRKVDVAILNTTNVDNLLLALEMKLSSNTEGNAISDIVRLAHLRYHGGHGKPLTPFGGAITCMFLYAGPTKDVAAFNLTQREFTYQEVAIKHFKSKDTSGVHDVVSAFHPVLLLDTTRETAEFALRLWKICLPDTFGFFGLVKQAP